MMLNNIFKKILLILITSLTMLYIIVNLLKLIFPLKYVDTIMKYSKMYNVDPYLIYSIINVESGFNRNAESKKDARGLMQIREITGEWAKEHTDIEKLSESDYFNVDTNIKIGTWYLSKLKSMYGNNKFCMLAAYNAGTGNVSKWLEDGNDIEKLEVPFKETRDYILKVNINLKFYKILYKGSDRK